MNQGESSNEEEEEGIRRVESPVDISKVIYQVAATYMSQRKKGRKYLSKGTYCGYQFIHHD